MLGVKGFTTVTKKTASGAFLRLPPSLEAGLTALALIWFSLIAALYLAIFYGSFVQIRGINKTLTLKHYADFWQQGWPKGSTTVKPSFHSAVPAMMCGGLIDYLVTRHRFLGRGYFEFGSLLPFATPGTVMGFAYILAFNHGALLMTGTSAIILQAFVFRNMPVAIRASMTGLSQIDRSLEEASATLRAVPGMTAVLQVIFLMGAGNNLAPVLLLSWGGEQGRLGRAAAMATVILGLLSLIVLLMVVSRQVGARNRKTGNSR